MLNGGPCLLRTGHVSGQASGSGAWTPSEDRRAVSVLVALRHDHYSPNNPVPSDHGTLAAAGQPPTADEGFAMCWIQQECRSRTAASSQPEQINVRVHSFAQSRSRFVQARIVPPTVRKAADNWCATGPAAARTAVIPGKGFSGGDPVVSNKNFRSPESCPATSLATSGLY